MDGVSNNSNLDWSRSEYDGKGRLSRASNPRSLVSSTEIPVATSFTRWTSHTYDALDRITRITTPDGQYLSTNYKGNRVETIDQVGAARRILADALGRMVTVIENNPNVSADFGSASLTTSYAYELLDNLVQVNQGAQTRTFTYDSLGRILSATLPEWGCTGCTSGTTGYLYDAASNLTQRTDPRSLVTTWNSYDSLNRPASISYSDTTPAVSFTYDSVSSTNGKGRLTAMSDGAGSESYHYDSMGRVTSLTRVMTGGPTLTSTYTWNLLGSLKEAAFPGIYDAVYPLTIFYDYDNAGRQKSAWWNNGSDYLQMVSTYSFNYTNTSATNYAQ